MPQVMVGGGVLGRGVGHESGALLHGITALIKATLVVLVPPTM